MTTQTQTFALSQLMLAPENARHGQTYDFDGLVLLASSIRELHRRTGRGLTDPLKVYLTAEGAAVWDGGRRRAALGLIADDGDDEGKAIIAAVPVIVTTQDEAATASLATFIREDMHPVDRFIAWSAEFDRGQTPDQIAAAVGATAKEVGQLLRFRALAPEILTAFRDGAMDFDAALAFTLSEDHERQLSVLASFNGKLPRAWEIKRAMTHGTVDPTDKRARYVGREAYETAGGRFLADLFSDREIDETWLDVDLLDRLFTEKLDAQIDALKAEGWGEVIVAQDRYDWVPRGYDRITPDGDGKKGKKVWTAEQMTAGTVILVFDYHGKLDVHKAYAKAAKAAGGAVSNAPLTPAKADPARYGWSHVGHLTLTTVATRAVQNALLANPAVAYDAALSHLAWQALGCLGNADEGVSILTVPYSHSRPKPDAAVSEALSAWSARLPRDRTAFCEAIGALTAEEKAQLLAASFASTLDASEGKNDYRRRHRWAHLGWIARAAKVDFAAYWTPDEGFMKGASREALEGVVKEIAPRELTAMQKAKKGVLAAFVAQKAEATSWAHQLFRDLLTPPVPPKPAKPSKRAEVAQAMADA